MVGRQNRSARNPRKENESYPLEPKEGFKKLSRYVKKENIQDLQSRISRGFLLSEEFVQEVCSELATYEEMKLKIEEVLKPHYKDYLISNEFSLKEDPIEDKPQDPKVKFEEVEEATEVTDPATFKTVACKNSKTHDKTKCPYYHSSQDKRRNPLNLWYEPVICPKNCQNGMCRYAHNQFEVEYHPEFYKLHPCQKENCGDEECPYAHNISEGPVDQVKIQHRKFTIQELQTKLRAMQKITCKFCGKKPDRIFRCGHLCCKKCASLCCAVEGCGAKPGAFLK